MRRRSPGREALVDDDLARGRRRPAGASTRYGVSGALDQPWAWSGSPLSRRPLRVPRADRERDVADGAVEALRRRSASSRGDGHSTVLAVPIDGSALHDGVGGGEAARARAG